MVSTIPSSLSQVVTRTCRSSSFWSTGSMAVVHSGRVTVVGVAMIVEARRRAVGLFFSGILGGGTRVPRHGPILNGSPGHCQGETRDCRAARRDPVPDGDSSSGALRPGAGSCVFGENA